MASSPTPAGRVFISYSHADTQWLERLHVHLKPLVQTSDLSIWDDTRLRPGSPWLQEIRAAIDEASVAVLLISADYLASDFIMAEEVPALLRRASERGATIVPVLVSPSGVEHIESLSKFQAVNSPSKTLVEMSLAERESTYVAIADTVAASIHSAAPPMEPPTGYGASPRRELFCEPAHWDRLLKVGQWTLDSGRILGEGVYTYLLSERGYGNCSYLVYAKLRFERYAEFARDGSCTANAGLVFGWSEVEAVPHYFHLLLTGKRILLEEVGSRGSDEYVDFRHLNEGVPFEVLDGQELSLTVRVQHRIDVWANNRPVYSVQRPSRLIGRVGLRPWRSRMECTYFEVCSMGA